MKIAAVQMVSTPDVARNLDAARRLVARAAAEGAALVALPEYFCLIGRHDGDKVAIAERDGDGPIQRALADAAREHGVWLIGGTLPIASAGDPERVRNACCVYAPDGSRAARYDKMHLFRFDDGREAYDEGRVLEAGDGPVAFELLPDAGSAAAGGGAGRGDAAGVDANRGNATGAAVRDAGSAGAAGGASAKAAAPAARPLRVGLSVCYDLRFPELYRALGAAAPCDLIAAPSAFTHTTGRAHWELLLRARAVENQCYVIAPAQGGLHENGRRTWGHSMVVDPWGEVLACVDEGEGVALAEMDAGRLAAVRRQLPALEHRRL